MSDVSVKLSQDKFALIDRKDLDVVSPHRWYFSHGYARTTINGKKVYLHRFLVNPPFGKIVDHINQDKLDNRRLNLRVVDKRTNQRNHKVFLTNSSGHNGISWNKAMKQWETYIWVDNKKIQVGYFNDIKNAVAGRRSAEGIYWND